MTTKSSTSNRRRNWLLATIAILVVGIAVYIAFVAVRSSVEAEYTLHTYYLVLDKTAEYCEKHRKWPANWEDLAASTSPGEWAMWKWPDDLPAIRERLDFDFSLTVDDVTKMASENFTAIRQKSPRYFAHDFVTMLLDRLKKLSLPANTPQTQKSAN